VLLAKIAGTALVIAGLVLLSITEGGASGT
jgi:hypothetical protein